MNPEKPVQNDVNPYLTIWARRALPMLERMGWELSAHYADPAKALVQSLIKARRSGDEFKSSDQTPMIDGLTLFLLVTRREQSKQQLSDDEKLIPETFWSFAL